MFLTRRYSSGRFRIRDLQPLGGNSVMSSKGEEPPLGRVHLRMARPARELARPDSATLAHPRSRDPRRHTRPPRTPAIPGPPSENRAMENVRASPRRRQGALGLRGSSSSPGDRCSSPAGSPTGCSSGRFRMRDLQELAEWQ